MNFVVRHESKITDGMNKEVTEATENGPPDARSLRSSHAFVFVVHSSIDDRWIRRLRRLRRSETA